MFLKGLPSLGKSLKFTDKTNAMQHMKMHSYLMVLLAYTFVFSTLGFSESLHANQKSKPIEILSDPFGYGVPTHYTILRGHTKATFSHPMFGQFTRAEIVQRENDGYRTTRFALSPDGKTYQPVMLQFRKFETYGYPKEDEHCLDPAQAVSPLSTLKALGPAVKDGELIAKRRDELAKARFFDASCFDPSVPEAHRNAIFNAAADVLTPELQEKDEFPKYLRCLERNGLAHESGVIQGYIQQALKDTAMAPKLKLSCTADRKAKSGQYLEKSKLMSLRLTPRPEREVYAQKVFHELLHTVPIRDGLPLELIEECCTLGEQCEALQAATKRCQIEERQQALLGSGSLSTPIQDAAMTQLAGSQLARCVGEPENTDACAAMGSEGCRRASQMWQRSYDQKIQCTFATTSKHWLRGPLNFAISSAVADQDCNKLPTATWRNALAEIGKREGNRTVEEVARQTPVTSPITWEAPVETQQPAVPIGGLASSGVRSSDTSSETTAPPARNGGGRTIASIAPLPAPAPNRSLGSARGRQDVAQSNRATVLVDTLEKAASSVTKQLTFEKLDARKVDPVEVFRSATKGNDSPMFVVASLSERPFQISNVADVKGLTFPNPFAKANAPTGSSMTLAKLDAKAEAVEQGKVIESKTGSESGSPPKSHGGGAVDLGADNPFSQKLLSGDIRVRQDSNGKTVIEKRGRSAAKSSAPDFENMSYGDLRKFLAGSYRQVAEFLEDQSFARALLKNGIQIYDHENRQIGATKAAMVEGQLRHTVFIYSAEKSRLIQSRATTKENR